jgi:hypothetical protein
MIIWGWRTCESVAGEGHFSCPVCRTQQRYRHLAYNRYFTLYFIPLIPLGRAGEQVECQGCFGRFIPEVLFAFPAAGSHGPNPLQGTVLEAVVLDEAAPPSQSFRDLPSPISAQLPAPVANPFGPPRPAPVPVQPQQTSSWAVSSLILGILSPFFLCIFGLSLFTSLAAVICGHLALRDIKRSERQLGGYSNAVAGLVLGYLLLAVSVVAWVAIAPGVFRALREEKQLAQNGPRRHADSLRPAEVRANSPAPILPEQEPVVSPPTPAPANPAGTAPFGFPARPGTPAQPTFPPGYVPPPGIAPHPGLSPAPGFGPPPGFNPSGGLVPPPGFPPTFEPRTPDSAAEAQAPPRPSRDGNSTPSPPHIARAPTRPGSTQPSSSPRAETLDEIVAVLKEGEPTFGRLYLPLNQLRRLPVDSARRDEVAALLDPLLKTTEHSVKNAAIKAVEIWGTQENVPTLLALLDSPDLGERWAAMEALGKIGGSKEAAQRLADLLTVSNDSLTAKRALEEMGNIAEEAVWPHVGHRDIQIHSNACQVLGKIGTPQTLAKLKARKPEREIVRQVPVDMAIRQLESPVRRPTRTRASQ